jgi:mRNA-degrading endonuclease toxin of MazEF toxin-antitoxin module
MVKTGKLRITNPKKGEIWLVQLDPTRGQEIQKTRPAVVISSEIFSSIPMRIIIPVATWQPSKKVPNCHCEWSKAE